MEEKNLEFKIGVLIVISVIILVVFILILGHFTTKDGFYLNIYFVNPGGLSPGAPVRISGSKVGEVKEMSYLGEKGIINLQLSKISGEEVRARVKVKVWIEERVKKSIHKEDSQYYITTQGILGEPFLEIDPGITGASVENEDNLFGIDPPRIDQVVANAANTLSVLTKILERNEKEIDILIRDSTQLIHNLNGLVEENRPQITKTISDTSGVLEEATQLLKEARHNYIESPQIDRIMNNLDNVTTTLAKNTPPLIENTQNTLNNANDFFASLGPQQKEQIRIILQDFASISKNLNGASSDIRNIVDKVNAGEGTVGALLVDEEVYDDLKELVRDLKHNPWRFFWRE